MNWEITAKYYKIKCAQEELVHLNVECRRLLTHIQDEEAWYLRIERELMNGSPLLAAEVCRACKNRCRVNRIHRLQLDAIHSLAGVTLPESTQELCEWK